MAAPLTFGPIYCEDAIALTSFPIEPVNTISNLVIVFFGLASLWYTSRRAPRAHDLYALGALLVANGIGSGLWHGLREPWALGFDVLPGLLFLFGVSFCWARRLWSLGGAVFLVVAFFIAFGFSGALFPSAPRWVSIAPAVVVTGLLLIGQTAMRSKEAALFGGMALAGTLTALFFRTIDLNACPYISVGTHFLWHIFNSAGAFAGVVALVTLQKAEPARSEPAAAA
jgi:hypothetical protein